MRLKSLAWFCLLFAIPAYAGADCGGCTSAECYLERGGSYVAASRYLEAKPCLEKACSLNDHFGCSGLGMLYSNGLGVKQDNSKAATYYKKACSLNDGLGCTGLGLLYYHGLSVRQDYSKAKTYFVKACNLNHGGGCNSLGFLYDNGQGVRQNKTKAKEYYGKACDLGDQDGCGNYRILNE